MAPFWHKKKPLRILFFWCIKGIVCLPFVINYAKASQSKNVKNKTMKNKTPSCYRSTVAQGKNQYKERCHKQAIPNHCENGSTTPLEPPLPHSCAEQAVWRMLVDSVSRSKLGLGKQQVASRVGAGEIRSVGIVWGQFRGNSLPLKHVQNWRRGYRKE